MCIIAIYCRNIKNGMSGIALTEDVGGVYGLVEVRVADVWAWGDLDRQMM